MGGERIASWVMRPIHQKRLSLEEGEEGRASGPYLKERIHGDDQGGEKGRKKENFVMPNPMRMLH